MARTTAAPEAAPGAAPGAAPDRTPYFNFSITLSPPI